MFRRSTANYDVSKYTTPGLLPPGIAAVGAFLLGVLGAVLGMSQTWFVGPIAIRIGEPPYGGDVGFELAFGFTMVSYLVFRSIEIRLAKR